MTTRANISTASKYIALSKKKEKLEADLKEIQAKMADMGELLLDYFMEHGIDNMRSGDRVVFIRREIWASLKNKEEGVKALQRNGYEDLVNINAHHQRLSAWIRELLSDAEKKKGADIGTDVNLVDKLDLPQDIKDQLNITEKFSLRVNK